MLAPAALGGCGFRPIYARPEAGVAAELRAIYVARFDDRLGQVFRNALLDQLNPTFREGDTRYELVVDLAREESNLAVQLDDNITRRDLTLTARFELRDLDTDQLLYRNYVRRVASFNVSFEPYATLVAQEDAERRAAREASTDIRMLLASYFEERAA